MTCCSASGKTLDATIPTLTSEERKRLAEYMRKSDPNFIVVLETLEKGGH